MGYNRHKRTSETDSYGRSAGAQPVNIVAGQPFQNREVRGTIRGPGTEVLIDVQGAAGVAFRIGSGFGSMSQGGFLGTMDGETWFPVPVTVAGSEATVETLRVTGTFDPGELPLRGHFLDVGGLRAVKICVVSWDVPLGTSDVWLSASASTVSASAVSTAGTDLLGKVEDSSHESGDVGVMSLGVRNDSGATTLTSKDGDYSPLAVDNKGRLGVSNLGGSLTVDDGGSSLTVDGTVTVQDGGGSLTVDGTVTVQDGGGTVSVDDGGSTVSVDDGGGSITVDGTVGVSGNVSTKFATPTSQAMSWEPITAASSGDNTLVSGTGGQTIRVYAIFFVVTSAVAVKFKDGAGQSLTGPMPFAAAGGMVLDPMGDPWFVTSSGNGFIMNLDSAVSVNGMVLYSKS